MASPLELIRDGIREADWKKVAAGYAKMSGEKIRPPAVSVRRGAKVEITVKDVPPAVVEEITRRVQQRMIASIESSIGVLPFKEERGEPGQEEEEEEEPEPPQEPPRAEGPLTVEDRARHARDVARGRVPQDFTHVHDGGVTGEGGRQCRSEPFRPGPQKLAWKDDRTIAAADIATDKKLTRGRQPTERREPARKVRVRCFKCEQFFDEDAGLAPRTIGSGEDADSAHYVCDGCMGKGGRD